MRYMARFLCGNILLTGDLKPQNLTKYPGVTDLSDCLSDCQPNFQIEQFCLFPWVLVA